MRVSPLRKLQLDTGATLAPYGPPEADVLLVETFGELELEYAALRKGCVLLDQPHRATLEITGADRLAFLNRMVTQELKGFGEWQLRRSFWLNRKGRIDADLRIIESGSRTLLDLDVHAAERANTGLSAFIITEDAQIKDLTQSIHRLAMHGPTAAGLLAAVSRPTAGPALVGLGPDQACSASIAGREVLIARDDTTGEPGFEILIGTADAVAVYQHILERAHGHEGSNDAGSRSKFGLRPAGWHAFNIARIEAGSPLYNIDFGPDSLPHETGVLHDRVNFKKGCYLGQEIVARMESRGHSKRSLVGFSCEIADSSVPASERPLPAAGAQIWRTDAPEGEPVGVVTSSTLSPMLGWTPVCFAAVKPEANKPGTRLIVAAEEDRIGAVVQPSLTFWKRP